jgi:hypothetical protein
MQLSVADLQAFTQDVGFYKMPPEQGLYIHVRPYDGTTRPAPHRPYLIISAPSLEGSC